MTMPTSLELITAIHNQATVAAKIAASNYFRNKLGGVDQFACGFAWVAIQDKIRKNSTYGKALESIGYYKASTGHFEIWNPSDFHVQNIDTLLAGAKAYAQVLQQHGINAIACSRMD